jgi:hypothetical protein
MAFYQYNQVVNSGVATAADLFEERLEKQRTEINHMRLVSKKRLLVKVGILDIRYPENYLAEPPTKKQNKNIEKYCPIDHRDIPNVRPVDIRGMDLLVAIILRL